MFDFRIIETADGNQIIDETLKTPYDSITAVEMVEYMEVDRHMAIIESMKRKQKREAEKQNKISYKLFHKVACICGIM